MRRITSLQLCCSIYFVGSDILWWIERPACIWMSLLSFCIKLNASLLNKNILKKNKTIIHTPNFWTTVYIYKAVLFTWRSINCITFLIYSNNTVCVRKRSLHQPTHLISISNQPIPESTPWGNSLKKKLSCWKLMTELKLILN